MRRSGRSTSSARRRTAGGQGGRPPWWRREPGGGGSSGFQQSNSGTLFKRFTTSIRQGVQGAAWLSGDFGIIRQFCCYPAVAAVLSCTDRRLSNGYAAEALRETRMKTDRRVVNNRVFLLGLDELYREAMKEHERDELLRCARETARSLSVIAADVPIEGYYSEDERLTEYFRLVRSLQQVPKGRESEVSGLTGFKRLKEVTES